VGPIDHVLDSVTAYCDVVDRLRAVPPSARVRGVYFRSIEAELERSGQLHRYSEIFPKEHRAAITFYPLGEYLIRLAVAGSLVASPERVHEGMFSISRGNASFVAKSLLGRALLRLLSRDAVRLTEQGCAARRQTTTYGNWSIVRHGERSVEMVYRDEYVWIESAIAGAAVGTFEACGMTPVLETRVQDRFNGSTLLHW
jgi:uncharacterized protein (TIGR02265 family)